ncbi:unnamed protein product [Boreogadus saida]
MRGSPRHHGLHIPEDPPPTKDRTTVEVRPSVIRRTLRRSLDQLEETLNMEMKKLRDDVELKTVQQYEVDVTLDPDTAHPISSCLGWSGQRVIDRKSRTGWTPKTGYWTLHYDKDGLSFREVGPHGFLQEAQQHLLDGINYIPDLTKDL